MTRILRLLFLLSSLATMVVAVPAGAQTSHAARCSQRTAATDSAVARIRRQVTEIERQLPTYRHLSRSLAGFSAEGGELQAHGQEGVRRGGVRKVVVTLLGETGRATLTYYYSDVVVDSLVLVSEVQERYDRPLSGNVVERGREDWFFEAGRLVCLQRQPPGTGGDRPDSVRAAGILEAARAFHSLAQQPDSAA